jgi:hypothetical protein
MARPGRAMLAAIAAAGALVVLTPGYAAAATISGTVSDEITHAGIAGIEVCPNPQPYTFETECAETNSSGVYSLDELPPWQYAISFSAWIGNLPYVSEYYDNKASYLEADPLTLGSVSETRQVDAELARGGSISGTLTDEYSGEPVANMAACASDDTGAHERCAKSNSAGGYQINGLPSGEYSVEYEGWNQANYLHEFYENQESWAQATRVTVTAPAATTGIDAELAKGAEILGHVTQAHTGVPLPEVFVCGERQDPGEFQQCDMTDAAGDYALVGLPAGSYLVAFGREYVPSGPAAAQWWRGVPNFDEATPIVIAPPETISGIDGEVDRTIWTPSVEAGSTTGPSTTVFSNEDATPALLRPQLPKCRKGFHRKLVKGKKRCVRGHSHHRSHQRRHR